MKSEMFEVNEIYEIELNQFDYFIKKEYKIRNGSLFFNFYSLFNSLFAVCCLIGYLFTYLELFEDT